VSGGGSRGILGALRSRSEEKDHTERRRRISCSYTGSVSSSGQVLHKGMRKPDFGTVDSAIAGCFYQGEVFRISRI